jgi:hypothetical protein
VAAGRGISGCGDFDTRFTIRERGQHLISENAVPAACYNTIMTNLTSNTEVTVLTSREAADAVAEIVGRPVHRGTIHRWCVRGFETPSGVVTLGHRWLGRRLLINSDELARFVERVEKTRA